MVMFFLCVLLVPSVFATTQRIDGVKVEEVPFLVSFDWDFEDFDAAEPTDLFCYEVGWCYKIPVFGKPNNFVLANGWSDGSGAVTWTLYLIQEESFSEFGYWNQVPMAFYLDYEGTCDS